jgi:PAS domain S-box-containing protein
MLLSMVLTALVAALAGAGVVYLWMRREHRIGRALWSMQDGVLVLDGNNRVISANPRFETYTGMAADEVIGMRYNDLLAQFDINTNTLDGVEDPRFEIIHETRILQPIVTATHDNASQPTGKVVIFRDMTRRSQGEQKLGTRLERLTALRRVHDELSITLNIQTVLMLALDAAHRLSGAHAGFIALKNDNNEYKAAQVIGAYDINMLNEMMHAGRGLVQRVIDEEYPIRVTNIYQNSDYEELLPGTQAVIATPLTIIDGTMTGVLFLSTPYPARFTEDVFQFIQLLSNRIAATIENARLHEQVETQLEALTRNHERISLLEKFKTDMIRMAAHDLNNPLSTITLKVDLLNMMGLSGKQQKAVDGIAEATAQMRELINNILSLERIEQFIEQGGMFYDVVDLQAVTAEVTQQYEPQAQEQAIHLSYSPQPTNAYRVRGERSYLQEAVANLVSNAVKYTPAEGSVKISLMLEEGDVVLCVQDTGYGIPLAQQPQIFQPFYRARTAETNHIMGSGLGLHLVKQIIKQHNGEMIFESEHGVGSKFGFRLPAANENVAVETTPR